MSHYAEADGWLIRLLLENGELEGLVIEGLGLSHVSSKTVGAIREVRAQGIPVVLGTRVPTGRIAPMYAHNVELLDLGGVEADNLSPQKTWILLMLAMTRTRDSAELQAYFDR